MCSTFWQGLLARFLNSCLWVIPFSFVMQEPKLSSTSEQFYCHLKLFHSTMNFARSKLGFSTSEFQRTVGSGDQKCWAEASRLEKGALVQRRTATFVQECHLQFFSVLSLFSKFPRLLPSSWREPKGVFCGEVEIQVMRLILWSGEICRGHLE